MIIKRLDVSDNCSVIIILLWIIIFFLLCFKNSWNDFKRDLIFLLEVSFIFLIENFFPLQKSKRKRLANG